MHINIDMIYPVGAVYISTVSTDPSILFGGSWEQIPGRFLVGAGSWTDGNGFSLTFDNGSSGGEYSHTLSIREIPGHRHSQLYWDASPFGLYGSGSSGEYPRSLTVDGGTQNMNPHTGYAGDGWSHNNVPPFYAVYMWKRIA